MPCGNSDISDTFFSNTPSSIVVGGLRPLFQTELSTQNYQQKSN